MAVRHSYEVKPGTILAVGIDDITNRRVFRAVMMEVVKAATGHVDDVDIEGELSHVYNMIVSE